jgi:hypothetical protein
MCRAPRRYVPAERAEGSRVRHAACEKCAGSSRRRRERCAILDGDAWSALDN